MTYKIHSIGVFEGPTHKKEATVSFENEDGKAIAIFDVTEGVITRELFIDPLRKGTVNVMKVAAVHKFHEMNRK
jgi:hypothetical protein